MTYELLSKFKSAVCILLFIKKEKSPKFYLLHLLNCTDNTHTSKIIPDDHITYVLDGGFDQGTCYRMFMVKKLSRALQTVPKGEL